MPARLHRALAPHGSLIPAPLLARCRSWPHRTRSRLPPRPTWLLRRRLRRLRPRRPPRPARRSSRRYTTIRSPIPSNTRSPPARAASSAGCSRASRRGARSAPPRRAARAELTLRAAGTRPPRRSPLTRGSASCAKCVAARVPCCSSPSRAVAAAGQLQGPADAHRRGGPASACAGCVRASRALPPRSRLPNRARTPAQSLSARPRRGSRGRLLGRCWRTAPRGE